MIDIEKVVSAINYNGNPMELAGGGGSLPSVISKIDGGSFTVASDMQGQQYNISHNLGELPKQIVVWTEDATLRNSTDSVAQRYLISAQLICRDFVSGTTTYTIQPLYQFRATVGTSSTTGSWLTKTQAANYVKDTQFNTAVGSLYYKAGVEYKWLAFV